MHTGLYHDLSISQAKLPLCTQSQAQRPAMPNKGPMNLLGVQARQPRACLLRIFAHHWGHTCFYIVAPVMGKYTKGSTCQSQGSTCPSQESTSRPDSRISASKRGFCEEASYAPHYSVVSYSIVNPLNSIGRPLHVTPVRPSWLYFYGHPMVNAARIQPMASLHS